MEVLDQNGEAIEGFSLGESLPIARNSIRMPVAWAGDPNLGALAGSAVRLRFHLTNASLYAFQFKGDLAEDN